MIGHLWRAYNEGRAMARAGKPELSSQCSGGWAQARLTGYRDERRRMEQHGELAQCVLPFHAGQKTLTQV